MYEKVTSNVEIEDLQEGQKRNVEIEDSQEAQKPTGFTTTISHQVGCINDAHDRLVHAVEK